MLKNSPWSKSALKIIGSRGGRERGWRRRIKVTFWDLKLATDNGELKLSKTLYKLYNTFLNYVKRNAEIHWDAGLWRLSYLEKFALSDSPGPLSQVHQI